jgi:hypothetical protein
VELPNSVYDFYESKKNLSNALFQKLKIQTMKEVNKNPKRIGIFGIGKHISSILSSFFQGIICFLSQKLIGSYLSCTRV